MPEIPILFSLHTSFGKANALGFKRGFSARGALLIYAAELYPQFFSRRRHSFYTWKFFFIYNENMLKRQT